MSHDISRENMRQLVGSLRSGTQKASSGDNSRCRPFVTISRQAGAGGRFGTLLAERLNRTEHSLGKLEQSSIQWHCMDRELVERIASDHHLSADLINGLEQSSHSFVAEFVKGLSLRDGGPPSDLAVVRRAAETVRALAQAGHVILVGLGGVFMTHNMPGGIHVRLIAPLEFRVKNVALARGLSLTEARQKVKSLDDERIGYFRTFWPNKTLSDELFHITLNSSVIDEAQMADCVLALLNPSSNPQRNI